MLARRLMPASLMILLVASIGTDGLAGSDDQTPSAFPVLGPKSKLAHDEGLFSVALTPDGQLIATADEDSKIHLWDAVSGTKKSVLSGHEGNIVDLQIDPEGCRLASAGHDGIRLWKLPSGSEERLLPVKPGTTTWIRFGPDGRMLACGGPTEIPIQLWDTETGAELQPLPRDSAGSRCAAFSTDGQKLTVAYSLGANVGEIRAWDLAARREQQRFLAHNGEVRKIVFTPDGRRFVTGDISGEVTVWDSESGGPHSLRLPDHRGEITALALSRDGSLLATASRDERSVRCWELATGNEISRLKGHTSVIKSIALSSNGLFAVSGAFDGLACVWSTIPTTGAVNAGPSPDTIANLEADWDLLKGDNAFAARQAMDRLRMRPDASLSLVRSHLQPLTRAQSGQIADWIDNLDHKDATVRRDAIDRLVETGDLAEIALRRRRTSQFGLAYRQRLDVILNQIRMQPVSVMMRTNLRAIQLLEQIDRPESAEYLVELASGFEHDPCTIAATNVLQRRNKPLLARVSSKAGGNKSPHEPSVTSTDQKKDPLQRPDFRIDQEAVALAAEIDQLIEADWNALGVVAAPIADDYEWLRRISLDLVGRPPFAYQIQDLVDDRAADKRPRMVEQLLASTEYTQRQVRILRAIFLGPYRTEESLFGGQLLLPAMERWLYSRLNENSGYDQIVRTLLTTPIADETNEPNYRQSVERGATPLGFYFRQSDLSPEVLAGECSRVFLGVKIECAQCHDHPFADWKLRQFWEFAAFFSGIRATKPQVFGDVTLQGDDPEKASIKIPNGDEVVSAHFLDGKEPQLGAGVSTRELLAEWITAPGNSYFARTVVNRFWAEYFGAGLAEPVDDVNGGPTSGRTALIDLIARRFIEKKYDLNFLTRAIVLTRAYQRTSRLTHESQREEDRLAKMPVRSLSGEQIHDSLNSATGLGQHIVALSEERRLQNIGASSWTDLVRRFSDAGPKTQTETSIVDAMYLMNGPFIEKRLHPRTNETLSEIVNNPKSNVHEKIDALFLSTLSRVPRPEESSTIVRFIEGRIATNDSGNAYADVLWALLNSGEFLSNH